MLQFGTGVLLRGLPDYYIDKANSLNIFNGKIVVVKSTSQGDASDFTHQDNIYTLCIQGFEEGKFVAENHICSSISRVLSAKDQWQLILDCASNQDLKIIISNTTDVGIELVEESIHLNPPSSFPAKLLAFLYKRYKVFKGNGHAGMVIIPTELIPENGTALRSVILELAKKNELEAAFLSWLEDFNWFCNSLVDRIVPGKPEPSLLSEMEKELGYKDNLLIIAEPFNMWAIEAPEHVKEILSFSKADQNVIIQEDIEKFRELKLRLLNGSHTFCCGLAYLCGFDTVNEAMEDKSFSYFIEKLLFEEIVPAIPFKIKKEEKNRFARQVIDRFKNPTLKHSWLTISANYSTKMKIRNVAVLLNFHKIFNKAPKRCAMGFAAFLLFIKVMKIEEGKYFGRMGENHYPINDTMAEYFYQKWKYPDREDMVQLILKDEGLWGDDLTQIPDYTTLVCNYLNLMIENGMHAFLRSVDEL